MELNQNPSDLIYTLNTGHPVLGVFLCDTVMRKQIDGLAALVQTQFGQEINETSLYLLVPSSIMRKFIYKSGRTQSAQVRETCP